MYNATLRHEANIDRHWADRAQQKSDVKIAALEADVLALRSALSNLLHAYQATSTTTGVTHAEKQAEDVLFQTRTN